MNSRWMKLLAILLAFGLIAAACGDDDDDGGGDDGVSTEEGSDDGAAEEGDDGAAAEGDDGAMEEGDDGAAAEGDDGAMEEGDDGSEAAAGLAGICPDPLIIQTDWFPEAEHGALYEMLGDDYEVDVDNRAVRGTLVDGGVEQGITWEVRTGGPAIGFAPVASYVYTDDSITLAYANTESQILNFADAPLLSVVAPLEKNPQMIMWDPDTYPDVETLADLGEEGVTINVFEGGVFTDVFVAQGIWTEDQIDPSYDGGPARFISEGGAIAQQGFASAEPYSYEFEFSDWGKPVGFQLLHDSGFEVYSQTIAIRPDDLEELRPCLEQVVPMIQRAVVSYKDDATRTNAIIVDAVAQFDDFWVYGPEIADFSIEQQIELGLVGNGPDSTVGNMDPERIQGVIDLIADAGLDTSGVTPDDIITNEFIDESVGF